MKCAIGIAVLLSVVCAVPLAAQSVTVTKPSAGSTCTIGEACLIAWTVSGQPGSKVILELMDKAAPTVVRLIVPEVPIGNLQYSWTIPNDVAAGQYRVQARVYGAPISDIGDVFTIKTSSGGSSGGIQVGKFHGGATPIAPIRFLEPTKTAVWTIDETHAIRWEAHESVKYPLWLFLVSKDHTIPIVDIGKVGSLVSRPTSKSWTVTDNLFDQEYCIRITSADNAVQVHSQPFRIKTTRIVKFDVPPSSIGNKGHTHNVQEVGTSLGGEFTTARLTPVPDPGGNIIKFGYQRWYEDGDNHGHILHRSIVKFNLSSVIAQLKHKYTVKDASFFWVTAPGSPQTGCPSAVLCLDAPLPNVESMFGDAFAGFPKHLIAGDVAVRAQMGQRWLDDPSKNYGVVVLAANEGQTTENGQCVRFVTNTVLKFEIEEKLNK